MQWPSVLDTLVCLHSFISATWMTASVPTFFRGSAGARCMIVLLGFATICNFEGHTDIMSASFLDSTGVHRPLWRYLLTHSRRLPAVGCMRKMVRYRSPLICRWVRRCLRKDCGAFISLWLLVCIGCWAQLSGGTIPIAAMLRNAVIGGLWLDMVVLLVPALQALQCRARRAMHERKSRFRSSRRSPGDLWHQMLRSIGTCAFGARQCGGRRYRWSRFFQRRVRRRDKVRWARLLQEPILVLNRRRHRQSHARRQRRHRLRAFLRKTANRSRA